MIFNVNNKEEHTLILDARHCDGGVNDPDLAEFLQKLKTVLNVQVRYADKHIINIVWNDTLETK